MAAEQAARLRAEELAHLAQMKSNDEIRKLREHLEKAEEELRKRSENRCAILWGKDYKENVLWSSDHQEYIFFLPFLFCVEFS